MLLAAAFLRHVLTPGGGGGEWPVLSSRYMLLGRSNTGVKLVQNANFPWLEQVGGRVGVLCMAESGAWGGTRPRAREQAVGRVSVPELEGTGTGH